MHRGRCPEQAGGQALGAVGVDGQALEDVGARRELLSSVPVRGRAGRWGPVLVDGQTKWPVSGTEVLGLHLEHSSSMAALGCVFL